MSTFQWWRSWHGAPMDHKWPVIAAKAGVKVGVVSAVAWAVFDYASQNEPRGSVEGFDEEAYAVYSGFPEAEIHAAIVAMREKSVIDSDGRLHNWDKRQPKREDNSADRVRKTRASNAMKRNVTQCNAEAEDVTIYSPSSSVSDSFNSLTDENQKSVSGGWYIRVFSQVTGMASFPGTETDKIIPALDGLYAEYNRDESALVEYLKPYWAYWLTKKGKGGRPYSRTNCAWLYDLAVAHAPLDDNAANAPHYAEVF